MTQRYLVAGGIAAALLILLLINSLYIVRVDRQAIVLQFGAAQDVINQKGDQAGLHFKTPFVQNVIFYDRRNVGYDVGATEVTTGADDAQQGCTANAGPAKPKPDTVVVTPSPTPTDGATPTPAATPSTAPLGGSLSQSCGLQRLVVDAFVRYRISDPKQFFRAAKEISNGEAQLGQRLQAAMRDEIGNVKASEIVSAKRTEVMRAIRDRLQQSMAALGVEVIDVRIRRADLPRENTLRVYAQMTTVFEAQAQGIRSLGDAEYANIKGEADRRAQVAVAEARGYAAQTRGDGDKTRTEIYAKAYGADPEFYAFWRSMQAYKAAIKEGTPLVLSPDSEFFRYFKDSQGNR
jgi:membrane protease subunit HflC